MYIKILKKIIHLKNLLIINFYKILFINFHSKYVIKSTDKKNSILIDLNWQNPIFYIFQIVLLSVLNSNKKFRLVSFKKSELSSFLINKLFKAKDSLCYNNIPINKIQKKIPGIHFFYDGLMKKKKLASFSFLKKKDHIDLLKKEKQKWNDQYFYFLKQIKEKKIKIAIVSHFVGIYHPLVAALLKKNVTLYHLNYLNNHMQCVKFNKTRDLFSNKANYFDVPTLNDYKNLSKDKRKKYLRDGKNYYKGLTNSKKGQISRVKAYGEGKPLFSSKKKFNENLQLNPRKKNVIILGNCWTDYPNSQGKSWFGDYFHWLDYTLQIIEKDKKYNWILKPHPAEHEYDGNSMYELIKKKLPDHIKFWPKHANSNDIIISGDIIISSRGSAGHEHILSNKKTLTAEKTRYSHLKLSKFCKNKNEYRDVLKNLQNLKAPTTKQKKKTLLYLSIVHSDAAMHKYLNNLPFGTLGLNAYKFSYNFLDKNKKKFYNETKVIKNWIISNKNKYNTFKKIYNDKFNKSN